MRHNHGWLPLVVHEKFSLFSSRCSSTFGRPFLRRAVVAVTSELATRRGRNGCSGTKTPPKNLLTRSTLSSYYTCSELVNLSRSWSSISTREPSSRASKSIKLMISVTTTPLCAPQKFTKTVDEEGTLTGGGTNWLQKKRFSTLTNFSITRPRA